jgi:hypothetical protein
VSDSSKRDQWDQHNRDEAKERATQQESAGPGHRPVPVQTYANLSGSPEAPGIPLDVAVLIDEYERATAAERLAWLGARNSIAGRSDSNAWNSWRDAVERTQRAARSLVDHETGRWREGAPDR